MAFLALICKAFGRETKKFSFQTVGEEADALFKNLGKVKDETEEAPVQIIKEANAV